MDAAPSPPEPKLQFSIRSALVVIAIFALGLTTWRVGLQVLQVPNDAYAMWAAGDVLIDYMNANNNQWPQSWDELAKFHTASAKQATMVGPFSEMQRRINIDFTFDPISFTERLSQKDVVLGRRVVTLKRGGDTHWSGREPNQRIFDHLRSIKYPSRSNQIPNG